MKISRKAETGMQHLLRLTLLRRAQLLKKHRRASLKEFKSDLRQHRLGLLERDRYLRSAIKAEKVSRRTDWLCGPLAPKRDVGEQEGLLGVAGEVLAQYPELPKRLQVKDEDVGIVAHDRVVVVRGEGRGRIGEVLQVNRDSRTVIVADARKADFKIPSWNPMARTSSTRHTSADIPIPLADVRLVATLTDDVTGHPRDVVVRHMHFGAPYIERSPFSNLPRHTRYITMSSENGRTDEDNSIAIPWPDEILDEAQATPADTRRLTVETRTYIPCPQMDRVFPSPSVVDELRTPHSRGRANHELNFVKQRVLIDMKNAWERERLKRSGVAIGTPTAERWAREMERRAKEREEREKRGPDPETLDIIKEEMARMRLAA